MTLNATARRWAPIVILLAIAAPAAVAASPSLQAVGLFAWGVAKVAAFGALGILLDRFAAPLARPHAMRSEAEAAVRMANAGTVGAALAAQAMKSADAANLRRAVTILGCQIAGAML